MARNRVIYQSEALFVTHQYTGGQSVDIVDGTHTNGSVSWHKEGHGGDGSEITSGMFHQIHRLQSANYNFSISRQDINQYGNLARIETAVLEAPTVSLDFTYLVTDGSNEDKLGITTHFETQTGALSGILANISGRNYHILTVAEGTDANVSHDSGKSADGNNSVISIGNGYITNYSVNAAIGGVPTASVSVEGLNITAENAVTGMHTPAIDTHAGTTGNALFSLPNPTSGVVGHILRPGDMTIELYDATGLLAHFTSGDPSPGIDAHDTVTSAHIQSFNIDVPLSRSVINRMGNAFGFSREIDFPITVSASVNAIVADLALEQGRRNLFNELYDTKKHNIRIIMRAPSDAAGSKSSDNDQIIFELKGVSLDSESFSSSIGDNKTVDLGFTATVGGGGDTTNGLFISGLMDSAPTTAGWQNRPSGAIPQAQRVDKGN
jgi:hypothetical protein